MPSPLTTLTLFGLKPGHWRWGLAQMGTMPPRLKQIPGLQFFKLLGSGKNRVFSLRPDFYLYGLVAVWENEATADHFFKASPEILAYQNHCQEIWTVKMSAIRSHGLWAGQNPFLPVFEEPAPEAPVAVLTRASIRLRALPAFWHYGTKTSADLTGAPGLIAGIGLGELPFVRQATFSFWESAAAMQAYAYGSAYHQEVIRKTRSDKWYSEELFARFRIHSATGTWKGKDPLAHLAPLLPAIPLGI